MTATPNPFATNTDATIAVEAPPNGAAKTFRTDSHPELDFYQPCNGGDNLIWFDINVHDVAVSAIESATLTLAVWDVDYNGSPPPERDEVYLNGHRLLTPVNYLTGANNQWSTVTFDVDPTWIVDGNNRVNVDIDVLSRSRWCVTVDWGELALDMGRTPEIEEIIITPDEPMTRHDVTFEAKIKDAPGYDIDSVDWVVTDVATGKIDYFSLDANPYNHEPPAGSHGLKQLTCTVFYIDSTTGELDFIQETKEFSLFFDKAQRVTWWNPWSKPNWFKYWNEDGAVPDMAGAKYDASRGGYGYSTPSGDVYLTKNAAGQHYINPIVLTTHFGTESFGGPSVKGIDTAAEVVAHERYHSWVKDQWKSGGSFFGKVDTDKGLQAADANDKLPDFYENATSHTDIRDTDTYDLEAKKSPTYRRYGDQEYMAMRAGDNARGDSAKDWAKPGKQTTVAYAPEAFAPAIAQQAVALESGYVGSNSQFTGTYSDFGVDSDGNSLYDYLMVVADLDIAVGGYYDVVAWLNNTNGDTVGLVNEMFSFDAGINSVDLAFEGLMVHHYETDGPYSLSVRLSSDEMGNVIDSYDDVYQTAAYSYTEFEGQQASFTDSYSDYGTDIDADGVYDYLTVEVGTSTVIAGDYGISGWLHNVHGNAIAFASQSAHLATGTQSVQLDFDGRSIAIGKVDGPYTLGYLTLDDVNGQPVDFAQAAYATAAYSSTEFETQTACLSGAYADYGLDADGDGFYETLVVDVGVNVSTAGNFFLQGTLYDGQNDRIIQVSGEAYLDTGSQSVVLEVPGSSIYAHGVDGPYYLKNLALYDGNGTLNCLIGDAHVTAAYHYTEFQRDPVTLTGSYLDRGRDTDGDGVFDYLTVDVGVIVEDAGTYAMNARLLDQSGNEIVWASTTSWLAADQPQIMHLDFDGESIFAHGEAGPYDVRDVYVYSVTNTALSDSVYEAWTTAAYVLSDFGESVPPVADAGGPYEGIVGIPMTLDASGSYDPDGQIVLYEWDWDSDGVYDHSTTAAVTEHTWASAFAGTVGLQVTNDSGVASRDTASVSIRDVWFLGLGSGDRGLPTLGWSRPGVSALLGLAGTEALGMGTLGLGETTLPVANVALSAAIVTVPLPRSGGETVTSMLDGVPTPSDPVTSEDELAEVPALFELDQVFSEIGHDAAPDLDEQQELEESAC